MLSKSLALLSLLTLVGCSNLQYRIGTQINDYVHAESKFEAECKEATAPCVARAQQLGRCMGAIKAANEAVQRGGAAKYQEKDMKTECAKVPK